MRIVYTMEAPDLSAFYQYHYWDRAEKKRARQLNYGIVLLTAFIALAVFFITNDKALKFATISVVCLLAIGMVFFRQYCRWYYRLLGKWAYKKMLSQIEEVEMLISEDQVQINTGSINAKIQWSHFKKFAETETVLLLYVSDSMAYTIPKRAIETATDLETIVAMASRKILEASNIKDIPNHLVKD